MLYDLTVPACQNGLKALSGELARALVWGTENGVGELQFAVARLAPHYREVLILCELSGLSYAETAQVCNVEIGTVRSRLSRARSALAQCLAPYRSAKEAVS